MSRTRHVFPTWEWGSPFREDCLDDQVLLYLVGLLQVAQYIPDLLINHLAALLPVDLRLPQAPDVDPVGGVCTLAPLHVAPEIAILVGISCQMMFHLVHGHLQRETNSMH